MDLLLSEAPEVIIWDVTSLVTKYMHGTKDRTEGRNLSYVMSNVKRFREL